MNLQTGAQPPNAGGALLLSSAQAPWQGVYLKQHAGGSVEPVLVEPRKHLIIVQHNRPTDFELKTGGKTQMIHLPTGHLAMRPPAMPKHEWM